MRMARRALACVLALAPSRGQVWYPDLIFSGACDRLSFLNGQLFQKIGMTMGGGGAYAKPYYKAQTAAVYMYYDPDCSGSGGGYGRGRWIIDTDWPDEGRWMDLDGDNTCDYLARVESSEDFPPMAASWRMKCGISMWEDRWVALAPVTTTSSTTGTSTTTPTTTTFATTSSTTARAVTSTTTTRTTPTTTTTTTSRTSRGLAQSPPWATRSDIPSGCLPAAKVPDGGRCLFSDQCASEYCCPFFRSCTPDSGLRYDAVKSMNDALRLALVWGEGGARANVNGAQLSTGNSGTDVCSRTNAATQPFGTCGLVNGAIQLEDSGAYRKAFNIASPDCECDPRMVAVAQAGTWTGMFEDGVFKNYCDIPSTVAPSPSPSAPSYLSPAEPAGAAAAPLLEVYRDAECTDGPVATYGAAAGGWCPSSLLEGRCVILTGGLSAFAASWSSSGALAVVFYAWGAADYGWGCAAWNLQAGAALTPSEAAELGAGLCTTITVAVADAVLAPAGEGRQFVKLAGADAACAAAFGVPGIAAPATASGGSPALQTLGAVAAGTAAALAGLALLALAWCCWCRRSRHKVGVEPCRYHMPPAPPPSYWANQDVAGAGFESWEDVSEDVEAAIRQLLWDTFRDIPTQDRVAGKMPSGLHMVKVSRIENSRIWAKYARVRDEIGARRPHACTPIGSITGAAVRTQAQGAPMGRSLRQGVNEHHLFHGTSPRGAAAIAKHGFDLALAGTGAGCMFGSGVYTAECSSKADEYAQDDQGGLYRDVFCLLLCRVVLGEALVMTQGGAATIPIIHSAIESGAYESVVGNREAAVGTYREFVVYDDAQVYPEYAILYKRRFESPDGF